MNEQDSDPSSFIPPSSQKGVDEFYVRLFKAAALNNISVKILGVVDNYPLLYLEQKVRSPKKRVLIAAGFHGDEVGGIWGLLHFLESGALKKFKSVAVSFLPLANPTGMKIGSFNNVYDEMTNSGYCHLEEDPYHGAISVEGKVLLERMDMLLGKGLDGFLTMHENPAEERAYLYVLERAETPGPLPLRLRNTLKKHFPLARNGFVSLKGDITKDAPEGMDCTEIRDGIILNFHDGTFEDRVFHDGVPVSICSETPGQLGFVERVEANRELVAAFLEFMESSAKSAERIVEEETYTIRGRRARARTQLVLDRA